ARSRYQQACRAWDDLDRAMEDDANFEAGDQWDDDVVKEREREERPVLTMPRLGAFRRQITNEQKRSRPAIQIVPQSDDAVDSTAAVLQGMVRRIEQVSKSSIAYDTAADHQVALGRGWYYIDREYDQGESFQQVIVIRRVANWRAVKIDPAITDPTAKDARFGFLGLMVPKDEYIDLYTKEKYEHAQDFFKNMPDEQAGIWADDNDGVLVVMYWYLKYTNVPIMLVQLAPEMGKMPVKEVMADTEAMRASVKKNKGTVLMSRIVRAVEVRQAKIDGAQILEGAENGIEGVKLPGTRIPLIPVIGEERHIKGKIDYRGITRDSKDACRMYNLAVTNEAEAISRAPKVTYIMVEGQDEGFEQEWAEITRVNRTVVHYKSKDFNGQLHPGPQIVQYEPNISAISESVRQHDRDLKAILGMFDASLGAPGPEQSGKAIRLRQQQGAVGTSHFMDNMALAIQTGGEIILEWIPEIYDTPRIIRILDLEDEWKQVIVHAGNLDQFQRVANGPMLPPTEDEIRQLMSVTSGEIHDLSKGKYGVVVSVGPSHESRRQEALEAMLLFIQAYPAAAPLIGDLIAETSDWPGARKLAERMKSLMPGGQQGELPPEVKAQMEQMLQQMQALKTELDRANQIIDSKMLEIASKERIASQDNAVELMKVQMQGKIDSMHLDVQNRFNTILEAIKVSKQEPVQV
ncbi:MAG: portal protein, partial [bacterium]